VVVEVVEGLEEQEEMQEPDRIKAAHLEPEQHHLLPVLL
jgi:hypothetical protein